jgi:hypothetical protein
MDGKIATLLQACLAVGLLATDAAGAGPGLQPAANMVQPEQPIQLAQRSPAEPKDIGAADVSLEIFPAPTVPVGTEVSFKVTVRKPGYVMLVDVDASGRLSQIYPSVELLAQFGGPNINFVKPGNQLLVPSVDEKNKGFSYVITPPAGGAAVVAILSEKRVQILDLPDLPQPVSAAGDLSASLTKWVNSLRVPDDAGRLRQSSWSLDVKPYAIQPQGR